VFKDSLFDITLRKRAKDIMNRIETSLPGVYIIEPQVFRDDRGLFFESYQEEKFAALGIHDRFVQDNHVYSLKNVLRGLHYRTKHTQSKLCRVIRGAVLDVVVDIRRGSPDFGRHASMVLSAENMRQVYVPAGFAHGYLVLSETAEFQYKCSDFYYPEHERGVLWNDAEIGIDWGIQAPILSAKDLNNPSLSDIRLNELPDYG
jgi:dTDP-4-dehydrorhamnose 3,5-epimerase